MLGDAVNGRGGGGAGGPRVARGVPIGSGLGGEDLLALVHGHQDPTVTVRAPGHVAWLGFTHLFTANDHLVLQLAKLKVLLQRK